MTKALEGGVVTFLTALVLAVVLFPASIMAHPGSGIVVDRRGEVYFIDTGAGVWKIDLQGKLRNCRDRGSTGWPSTPTTASAP